MVPTVDQVRLADVLSVVLTIAAVWGLAVTLFKSFAAEELSARLHARPDFERLRIRQWELSTGEKYNPARVSGNTMAGAVKLSPLEAQAAAREYLKLRRSTCILRVLLYGLGCTFCQCFWSAVIVLAVTNTRAPAAWWIISALAYAALASKIFARPAPPKGDKAKHMHISGGGCGQ